MGDDNQQPNDSISKQIEDDSAVLNPIIGLEVEDEGVDEKEWLQKEHLRSQGFCGTFKFFCKQSCKDVRRHKCQFCLGFSSVFVVVLMTLIINTLIDMGPIIFLRLAEGSAGQVDAYITSEANSDTTTYKFTNLTQILNLYDDKYLLSPRKYQDATYYVPDDSEISALTESVTTGLPLLTSNDIDEIVFNDNKRKNIYHINTNQEDKLGCGRTYDFGKLDLGECLLHKDMANYEKLKKGDIVYLTFDVNRQLYMLWNHYKELAGDTTSYVPQMGTIVAPCKVAGSYSNSGGKLPKSDDSKSMIMEFEYFYRWIAPYIQPDDTDPSMDAFRQFLAADSINPEQFSDEVIMNFPDPRIDYYKESDYDDIQDNVVSYANKIVNDLGFFPITVSCDILEELQSLSLGLVFLGIIFSIVSFLFVIISVLLIYSLLMVTVEEKSFEIGIYRMVGLNKLGLVIMVLLKAFFFVLPAILAAFIICVPILWVIFRQFLDDSMGTTLLPLPTGIAVLYALAIGILIPILSSLYPLGVVLGKNLTEALDYTHSKTKAVYVKIVRATDFDRTPYIIFGLISVAYGLSIYYFLPLALISLNFGLLLTIFFLILIGMFIGMVLLALNIQRILEIALVYIFLFYETTSMRILVLKNLIAHKPRNRMTVSIYAMSVGFLIMIVVSYNLEIRNSIIEEKMANGAHIYMSGENGDSIIPSQIEPYLKEVEHLIDAHAYQTFEVKSWKSGIDANDLFLSDELTLINIPTNAHGVGPFFQDAVMKEYISLGSTNTSSGLGITEQLYTARGSQGSGMGQQILRELSLNVDDWDNTFKINLFTDNWNVFMRLRPTFACKYFPGLNLLDRNTDEANPSMLISIPSYRKLIGMSTSIDDLGYKYIKIQPKDSSGRSSIKIKLAEAAENMDVDIYDSQEDDDSFDSALYILDIIFSIVIGFVMFLCFFSLSSSVSANMIEQRKEIGVLRAIGLKKGRIYFLYIYECFILIFSGCMIGVMIGTLIGWTMMLQRVLFSSIPLSFFFPWIQVLTMFLISIICALLATIFPARNMLKKQISEIFRSG